MPPKAKSAFKGVSSKGGLDGGAMMDLTNNKAEVITETEAPIEPVEEIKYEEFRILDNEILFDRRLQKETMYNDRQPWSPMDRTVFELYKSMLPTIVASVEARQAMKTAVLPVHPNEERGDTLSPTPSIQLDLFRGDDDVSDDVTSISLQEEGGSEMEVESVEEPIPFRERLATVREMMNEMDAEDGEGNGVLMEKMAAILNGESFKPRSPQRDIYPNRLDRDQDVNILFINENRYIGRLSRLCLEGHGQFKFVNGVSYVGAFENNTFTGKGRIEWSDLSWYEGEFIDNRRHGRGMFENVTQGGIYMGYWFQGQRQGHGRQYYDNIDGNYYEGGFYQNRREGEGIRIWGNGLVYHGTWHRDRMHGYGMMRFKNGTYKGDWCRGKMHGKGVYTWSDSDCDSLLLPRNCNVYEGNWKHGKRHGQGLLRTAAGVTFLGTWKQGKKEGHGVLERRNDANRTEVTCRNDIVHVIRNRAGGDAKIPCSRII
ncbi:hypothetical protein WDU94_003254 [Cyamophila willieti]